MVCRNPTRFRFQRVGQARRDSQRVYRRRGEPRRRLNCLRFLFRFLENKMWLDELYAKTILAGSALLSRAADWMDRHVWDGLVRGVGGAGQFLGILTANTDERGINAGVDEGATGTRGLGRFISARHSGQIQTYMGVVAVGMLALLILYAWLT